VDSSGNVYVVEYVNCRVQKFRMSSATNQPARVSYPPILRKK